MTSERGLAEMRQAIELMRKIKEQAEHCDAKDKRDRLGEQCGIADASFHLAVLRRAGNELALRMVRSLHLMPRVFSQRPPSDRLHRLTDVIPEHTQILEAIQQHDAKNASLLMRKHIRGGRKTALQYYDRRRREENPTGVDSGAPSAVDTLLTDLDHQIQQLEKESTS